jgi:hypothetical protein
MRLLLIAPGAELHTDRLVLIQLGFNGFHQGGLAGSPAAEYSDSEPRRAPFDDFLLGRSPTL